MKLTIFAIAAMLGLILAAGMLAYRVGYQAGYTDSLVRQERGLAHRYVLEEQRDGTWDWMPGNGTEAKQVVCGRRECAVDAVAAVEKLDNSAIEICCK